MESVIKILEDAREDGMSVILNIDTEGLIVKGIPKAEETWIPILKEHKHKIIQILKNEKINHERIEKTKSRLRKGHTYFMGVDDKIFKIADKEELSELEERMSKHLDTWIEIEAEELRALYEYEGCIYNDGKCPPISRVPVRCTYCYENSLAESST
tara:strand:- start:295 stop:762 length:468 start_codon:yes stop_codon:yes gene_type:complete